MFGESPRIAGGAVTLRGIISVLTWVGRTTSTLFGLGLFGAMALGLGSMAFGANGQAFILGVISNTATTTTRLFAEVAGKPALWIVNPSTTAGSRALHLQVAAGQAPLVVNAAAGKAMNLNADKVDGKDAPLWAVVEHTGTLKRAYGATSSTKWNTGSYDIVFDKPVDNCVYSAVVYDEFWWIAVEASKIVVANPIGNVNAVRVFTMNNNGLSSDRTFHLVVNC